MKRRLAAILFALAMLATGLSGYGAGVRNPNRVAPDSKLQGSYRTERNGWIYVHLEGSPDRLGYQHGYLLADEIGDLLRVEKPFLLQTTKRDWEFYRQASEKMLWPKIDSEFQREIDGIVAGANAHGVKADRWDIVALNAICELPGYYV